MISIADAMKIGQQIADYKHRQRLELLERDPLRQAQALYYRSLASLSPYQAEVYQAQARQAIPAQALRSVSEALYEVPSRGVLMLSQARYAIPAQALGTVGALARDWLSSEPMSLLFQGIGPLLSYIGGGLSSILGGGDLYGSLGY